MYRQCFRRLKIQTALITLIVLPSFALGASQATLTTELISTVGKQGMFSQRIAKDYLYKGAHIEESKMEKQLKITLEQTRIVHSTLIDSTNNPKISNLLAFVEMNNDDFEEKIKENFSLDNAQYVLDLSESLLEGNKYIMKSLKKSLKVKNTSTIVDISETQSMLSQRIAKYYIAYQLGIKDKNTVNQMNKAVQEFSENHKLLYSHKSNSKEIKKKLEKIDRLWNIVYKFYLDIETGGLPFIVFTTTDKITKQMDAITSAYIKLEK